MTFQELCNRLAEVEETMLLELLDINSEAIVYRFTDYIEAKREYLEEDLELDDVFCDDEILYKDEIKDAE